MIPIIGAARAGRKIEKGLTMVLLGFWGEFYEFSQQRQKRLLGESIKCFINKLTLLFTTQCCEKKANRRQQHCQRCKKQFEKHRYTVGSSKISPKFVFLKLPCVVRLTYSGALDTGNNFGRRGVSAHIYCTLKAAFSNKPRAKR